ALCWRGKKRGRQRHPNKRFRGSPSHHPPGPVSRVVGLRGNESCCTKDIAMVFGQPMTAADWAVWIAYELVVAVAVFAKTVLWFRRGSRVTRSGLESWVGLLVVALFVAIGLGRWLESSPVAALIAFGLASALIVGAAVPAAYELGLKDGERVRDTQARSPSNDRGIQTQATEPGGRT